MAKSKTELSPTAFERSVIDNYIICGFNGARAYRETPGGTAKCASRAFCDILRKPKCHAYYKELMAKWLKDSQARTDDVLELLSHQAAGDVSELLDVKMVPCRYCHGEDNLYQFRPAEWRAVLSRWVAACFDADEEGKPQPTYPDKQGGVGYSRKGHPNPDCPECDGEGIEHVKVKDTRNMTPAARAMFAGAKQTKDGIEIKFHDAAKARAELAKIKGLLDKHAEAGAGEIHVHLDSKDSQA